MKKRALISVSNKNNIVPFAEALEKLNYEIISTGGTLQLLQAEGINAVAVESVTDFPEILDGRVKTLHPNIHGGLLAKRDNEQHDAELQANNIQPIDLVVVNLYPFKETLIKDDVTDEEIIENIDIGGPTMLRAAAKNYEAVAVIVEPDDYDEIIQLLKKDQLDLKKRKELAAKVFRHTAQYDATIATYFNAKTDSLFPEDLTFTFEKVQSLRYGENPHQKAAFYRDVTERIPNLANSKQLHGKELSYNNIQDANAAVEIVKEYKEPTAVAVKHMNPCGIGLGSNMSEAFDRTYKADPISIFGGIVACNRAVDKATAEKMNGIFLEIVIAPEFTEDALAILTKKKNIRLIEMKTLIDQEPRSLELKTVTGGLLLQTSDDGQISANDLMTVTRRRPTEEEIENLLFAWHAVKHVKSNAIVLAKDFQTIGIGAGQMNRIGAARIAIEQAGKKAKGAVLASDAFFPMPDTVEVAAKAGVTAIIQPGGSKRDQDSIDVCNEHEIAMVTTNMRHFKH